LEEPAAELVRICSFEGKPEEREGLSQCDGSSSVREVKNNNFDMLIAAESLKSEAQLDRLG
jgi:hypothetical protein